jgi:hypothetical protein
LMDDAAQQSARRPGTINRWQSRRMPGNSGQLVQLDTSAPSLLAGLL